MCFDIVTVLCCGRWVKWLCGGCSALRGVAEWVVYSGQGWHWGGAVLCCVVAVMSMSRPGIAGGAKRPLGESDSACSVCGMDTGPAGECACQGVTAHSVPPERAVGGCQAV